MEDVVECEGNLMPVLLGDPAVLPAANRARSRIATRIDHLELLAAREDLHEGTRKFLRGRIASWRRRLATVAVAVIWDGADSLDVEGEWEDIDRILKAGLADYDTLQEWLGIKALPFPLRALEEWQGYTAIECAAWYEHFVDRVTADQWRERGWQPDEVATMYDAVFRQARADHPDDDEAQLNEASAALDWWRQSGIPTHRCALYARLGIGKEEAIRYEADAVESPAQLDAALATLVALRS